LHAQLHCLSALQHKLDEYFALLIVDPLDKHAGGDNSWRTHPLLLQVNGKVLD